MTIGEWNPIPTQIGGDATPLQSIYLAMLSSVGGRRGGAVGPADGIEDSWRFAKAMGLALVARSEEQALMEFLPRFATYRLAEWEQITDTPHNDVLEQSRQDASAVLAAQLFADIPHLQERLRALFDDDAIAVNVHERTLQAETYLHKTLGDRTGVVPYGPIGIAAAPHYTTAYVAFVTWPAVTAERYAVMGRVLNRALPGWVDWQITDGSTGGFELGVDPLGMTSLEE